MWKLLCTSTQCDISDAKASLHKGFHGITERFGLEGTSKYIYFQHTMAMGAIRGKVPSVRYQEVFLYPCSHQAGHGTGGDDKCKRDGSSGETYAPAGQEAGSSHIFQLDVLFKGHCLSFICEMQSSDENLGHGNLCTSNTKRQLLSILLLPQKRKQKMIAKPGKLSGLCCSEQPSPTQQEKESQRGRAAEITHSAIYCPKSTSSTKGTTVIIGVKIHSLLTCECDLQRGFIPSKRAFGTQERWADQLRAAACGAVCRLEGHLTERGELSPDPAQPQHFQMHPTKTQTQLWWWQWWTLRWNSFNFWDVPMNASD